MSEDRAGQPVSSGRDHEEGCPESGSLVRWTPLLLLSVAGIGAGLFLFARAEAPEHSRRWVSLEEPDAIGETSMPDTKGALRVAVAPVISPENSLRTYQAFAEFLARRINRQPIFLQRQTYVETNELLRNRRCDIAFVCSYAFVRAEKEFGLQALVVPQIKGSVTYHSLIIVPASSTATSLLDIRGRRFGSADLLSNTGWLYPAVWLLDRNENVDHFFGEHVVTGSHDRSVEAVANRRIDGAAVDSIVYEQMLAQYPELSTKVRILYKSPPFGMPPVVVHPQIDPDLRSTLLKILLKLHEDAEGLRILTSLGVDRFVVPEPEYYVSVRENMIKWEKRKP